MNLAFPAILCVLLWLTYRSYYQSDSISAISKNYLLKLSEIQSQIALKASMSDLNSKASVDDLNSAKLELLKKISSLLDSSSAARADIDSLKMTSAIIASLSSDSENFKKYMVESTQGINSANVKIVNMAKDISDKVSKSDLDQVRNLLGSKANVGDISKLAALISSIESRLGNNISEQRVFDIISSKADKSVVDSVASSVADMVNSISGLSKSVDDLRTSTRGELSDKINSLLQEKIIPLSDLSSSANGKIDNIVSQLSTIKAGLDGKADVTLVSSMNTSLQKLLSDVPALKASVDILSSLGGGKLAYIPEEPLTLSTGQTCRFAMVVNSGVVSIGYKSYTKDKNPSISLEQMRHLLANNEGGMNYGATAWFKSQVPIDATKPSNFNPQTYIQGLMNLNSMGIAGGVVLNDFSYTFSPGSLAANTEYNSDILKPTGWSSYSDSEALMVLSRLTYRAIQSMINISSRYDCTIEFVINFTVNRNVVIAKSSPAVLEWKVSRDQFFKANGRYQPKVSIAAAIDASNGLIVPYPTYFQAESYLGGIVSSKDSKARCPMNSYVCGLKNDGATQTLYPLCCEFNPGTSSSTPL